MIRLLILFTLLPTLLDPGELPKTEEFCHTSMWGIWYKSNCLTQREALKLAREINGTEHWARWGGH